MIHRLLVTCSFFCCMVVIASFAGFAVDQASGASSQQVAALNSGAPQPVHPATHHTGVRRFVDRVAADLTYPIHSLLPAGSQWADEILLLAFGLAVYGAGLGYLSRYTAGMS